MADKFQGRVQPMQRIFNATTTENGYRFRDRSNQLETLNQDEIRARCRYYQETIYFLLELVYDFLDSPTKRSLPLPPLTSLLVTLQFFACGTRHIIIGDLHSVSKQSVGRAVDRVTLAL